MGSLLEKYGWHEWINHSNFSFLTGASDPEEYVTRALQYQYGGLGIVDYDGVYGIVRAFRALQQLRKNQGSLFEEQGVVSQYRGELQQNFELIKNFKLSYGAELHLKADHQEAVVYQDTLVLKALSRQGYFHLCRLLSRAHEKGKHDAYISLSSFSHTDLGDLVAICPMRGLIRRGSVAEIEARVDLLKQLFGKRFYIGLTRSLHPSEDDSLPLMMKIAEQHGVPTLLTQDTFMHCRRRKTVSDVLHAMRHNRELKDISPQLFANGERCLHSLKQIESIYGDLPVYEQSLRHSRELAEQLTFDLDQIKYHYPRELVPEGLSTQEYLVQMTWEHAYKLYRGAIPEKVERLIQYELKMIEELGFADYFLTVWDIVRWAREQNILCQGRGSAANSSVCFALGVTAVDPTKFDVLFERFISVERGDPPDIDVDFEHERREEVIQYIYERFGRRRAAMVANVITFKARGALRFVGKALGVDDGLISRASELISSKQYRSATLPEVLARVCQEQEEYTQQKTPWKYWGVMAQQIHGFPRHMGIHSGGFVVSDADLNYLSHQEPATMEGRSVIAWSKEDIEALGFFKIDILALGMLTAVRKCMEAVKKYYQQELQMHTIPQDDTPTYRMLQQADTVGTFQVESRAQMAMLPRLRPQCLYDLVVEVGIVRPGPIQGGFIHPYLKRRQGKEPITYPHPRLKPILERTKGIPIFQEQVMRIAIEIGGFKPGEADELRRQMGAWNFRGDLGPLVKRMAQGMRERGVAEDFVQQVLQQVRGFAEYGFPESHAVSFAMVAYVSCFLKCHYPAAFTMALLNSQPLGFYSPHALIQDAKRHGIQIRPICVKYSDWDSKLEETAYKGQYAIRLGMRLVKGLAKKSAERVVAVRQQTTKPWKTIEDFLEQSGLDRGALIALASADAMSVFSLSRRSAVWMAIASPYAAPLEEDYLRQEFRPETKMEKIELDFHHTTTSLGPHPVELIKQEHWCYPVPIKRITVSQGLAQRTKNKQVFVFGMVLIFQAPPSAKGMVFITLEDETGFINLALTPDIYKKYADVLRDQSFVCASGILQGVNEGHSVLVKSLYEMAHDEAEVFPMQEALNKAKTPPPFGAGQGRIVEKLQEGRIHPTRNFR